MFNFVFTYAISKGNVHISIQRMLKNFSLIFLACRPELWSSFWIKNQIGGKIISPHFSDIKKKRCVRSMWGVKSNQHWVGKLNSGLYNAFPTVRIPFPPPLKPSDFITRDFSLIFCMQSWIVYGMWTFPFKLTLTLTASYTLLKKMST